MCAVSAELWGRAKRHLDILLENQWSTSQIKWLHGKHYSELIAIWLSKKQLPVMIKFHKCFITLNCAVQTFSRLTSPDPRSHAVGFFYQSWRGVGLNKHFLTKLITNWHGIDELCNSVTRYFGSAWISSTSTGQMLGHCREKAILLRELRKRTSSVVWTTIPVTQRLLGLSHFSCPVSGNLPVRFRLVASTVRYLVSRWIFHPISLLDSCAI